MQSLVFKTLVFAGEPNLKYLVQQFPLNLGKCAKYTKCCKKLAKENVIATNKFTKNTASKNFHFFQDNVY